MGDGDAVYRELLDEGVIVRPAGNFGLPDWVRITIGLPEELDKFEAAFTQVMARRGGE